METASFWSKVLHVLGQDVVQSMAPKQLLGMAGMVFQV
jgi:hypothetical protein